jgi:hypothetical protein
MKRKIIIICIMIVLVLITATLYTTQINEKPASYDNETPMPENLSNEEKSQVLERLKSLGYIR